MPTRSHATAFINGCFDALHQGHLHLIRTAASQAGRLTIAVNTDDYCRRKKGPFRPTQTLQERQAALRQATRPLNCLIKIITQHEDTPETLLARLKPRLYLLGSDYEGQPIPGAAHCAQIHFVPRLPGISTTEILKLGGSP